MLFLGASGTWRLGGWGQVGGDVNEKLSVMTVGVCGDLENDGSACGTEKLGLTCWIIRKG